MEFRIEELAKRGKTSVRNIRAYQDRGILPPPRRDGRVVWYSDAHLARLRVISTLLERGYSIGNIAEMLEAWEQGNDLAALLGLEEAITRPFAEEPPTLLSLSELASLFGTIDPVFLARGIARGLGRVIGTDVEVPSMRLLRAGAELHRAGIPLDVLLAELGELDTAVDRIAERFVDAVVTNVFDRYATKLPPPSEARRLAALVRRIRPLAEVLVTTQLARALDRHIRARLGERLGAILGGS